MKKVLILLLLILNGLFITGAGNRYYTKANSEEEAEIIAKDHNLKLESYSEGIAVLLGEYNTKELLASKYNIKASDNTIIYEDSYCLPVDIPASLKAAPEDNPYWMYNYYTFNDINWITAYHNGITGKGITVAVLDTGCMINHPDLAGAIVGTYNAVEGSTDVTDKDGHGTHVAGIIAARDNNIGVIGIAPESSLYIMKVESDDGYMYHSNIIRALNKCADDPNISVINMSFYGGTSNDNGLKEAMQNCLNKGKICVMAAGNTSSHPTKSPACFGLGLIVAYYYGGSNMLGGISNYGGTVNVIAPGCIWSTYNNGSYIELSGTSMATPVVSATAALIYNRYTISKDINGSNYVKNLILNNKNNKSYSILEREENTGGLDIQKTLNLENIEEPAVPIIGVKEEDYTKQAKITMFTNKPNYKIYYTLDGSCPNAKNGDLYTKAVYIDTPGDYTIRAVAVNKNRYSYVANRTFSVSSNVISKERIDSVEIYVSKKKNSNKVAAGSTVKLKIKNKGTKIPLKKFKWKSSNKKIATVKNGIVKINKNAKKGKKVKIKATLGGITKSITLKIK